MSLSLADPCDNAQRHLFARLGVGVVQPEDHEWSGSFTAEALDEFPLLVPGSPFKVSRVAIALDPQSSVALLVVISHEDLHSPCARVRNDTTEEIAFCQRRTFYVTLGWCLPQLPPAYATSHTRRCHRWRHAARDRGGPDVVRGCGTAVPRSRAAAVRLDSRP